MTFTGFPIYRKNRHDSSNWFSRVNFIYCWGFFLKHFKKDLKITDLELCPKDDKSEKLGDNLEKEWMKELKKSKPSFLAAVHRAFGLKYALLAIIIILDQCVFMIFQTVVTGWLVRDLVRYNPDDDGADSLRGKIYTWGALIIILQSLIVITVHPYFFETFRMGMDIRIAACHLIYKKSLKLSKSALAKTTIGQIVNMLSNDVNRFDWLLGYPHYFFIGPVCTIIVTIWLYWMEEFGNECLPGIAILLLYIPMQAFLGKVFTSLRVRTADLTDERVRITNEFVKAMKVIKMYAWEVPFTKLVDEKRREEVAMIKKASYLRGFNLGLFFVSTKIILFIMLFLYVYSAKPLTSQHVFVAMGLINQLRTAVCLYVPYAVSFGAESLVSMKRIQDFLQLDEVEVNNKNHIEVIDSPKDAMISFKKVSCDYKHNKDLNDSKNDRPEHILTEVDLEIFPGELLAIIGTVGCGKSSVLMAILNELPIISGEMLIKGKISYASQVAWTVPGSLRDNILFGKPFSHSRYNKVVEVCALERDFQLFLDGDRTRVGDTGLSGGQRARINLARALYVDADIYLLDDPLSAVDASVAKHIFEQAINGTFLKEKIRVLITHQLQFIKSADKLLLLKNGHPEVYGDYKYLLSKGVDFMKFNPIVTSDQQHTSSTDSGNISASSSSSDLIVTSGNQIQSGGGQSVTVGERGGGGGKTDMFKPSLDPIPNSEFTYTTSGSPPDSSRESPLSFGQSIQSGQFSHSHSSRKIGSDTEGTDLPVIAPGASGQGYRQFQRTLSRQGSRVSIRSVVSRASVRSHHSFRSRVGTLTKRDGRFTDILKPSPDTPITTFEGDGYIDGDGGIDEDYAGSDAGGMEGEERFERPKGAAGKTYWTYFSAGGGCTSFLAIIVFMGSCQFIFTFSDWWLSKWTDRVEHQDNMYVNHTPHPVLDPYDRVEYNSYIYAAQTIIVFVLAIVRTLVFFIVCMKASVKLHDRLFKCLVRAPMAFFDNNPIGILLNRCSRDIGIIDDILPPTFFDAASVLLVDLGSAILICFIDPWILIPTVALLAIFVYLRRLYVDTARSVKKLEGATRSPVFSHLATSLNGLATIRAFKCQDRFMAMFDVHQNNHTSAWFHFLTCSRWFGVTLDWLCVVYIAAIIIAMLSNLNDSNGSAVGLAITSAILLSTGFQWGIRQATEVETQMTSVERVDEYSHLESEGFLEVQEHLRPPPSWPDKGIIEFSNVSLTYNESDGPVLRNLSFEIQPSEKIGIVGRTGAGKSSIINTLFRLTEPEGDGIFIDGIDTRSIGLHDLRRKISIIPQEPVLFTGTIRKNLDPFDEIPDGKLWRALDEVQLRETVQDIPGGLNAVISEEQSPFSVGQRQLVCMARAIIRQNRILILDEATANVDPKTDFLIQDTIRRSFAYCTVLTIAHRLDTIIDTDRVLVLDAGQVAEFDEPIVLLKNEDSIFSAMCRSTGKDTASKLKSAAQKSADVRRARSSGPI